MSVLYVVATPIGNLQDISLRALEVFKSVDVIICEDTRVTSRLLAHYGIKAKLVAYHQQSSVVELKKVVKLFGAEIKAALVTDAGTPGIQDPGNKLISQLVNSRLAADGELKIVPIPGPSAVTALASISGLPTDSFMFLGYWPKKKGTQSLLIEVKDSRRTVIFYEAGSRILKTLNLLTDIAGQRQVVVGRELTKQFETIYRGIATEVIEQIKQSSVKGEFVVLIAGK
jgi:16S rRNA (cytidine1402-2'-O)-methyltransferase